MISLSPVIQTFLPRYCRMSRRLWAGFSLLLLSAGFSLLHLFAVIFLLLLSTVIFLLNASIYLRVPRISFGALPTLP